MRFEIWARLLETIDINDIITINYIVRASSLFMHVVDKINWRDMKISDHRHNNNKLQTLREPIKFIDKDY